MLFMMLTALRRCGEWDVAARTFSDKLGTIEKMIISYLNVLSPHLYKLFVEINATRDTMKRLQLTGNVFKEHPCARYATDVTFQKSNMPSGTQKDVTARNTSNPVSKWMCRYFRRALHSITRSIIAVSRLISPSAGEMMSFIKSNSTNFATSDVHDDDPLVPIPR
jgi:hypothetical protein